MKILVNCCSHSACARTQIANINSDQQIVISGSAESIQSVSEKLKTNGAKRIIALPVSGAFHSKLMSDAKPELKKIISNSTFNEPTVPIVSNFDATLRSNPDEIKKALINYRINVLNHYGFGEYLKTQYNDQKDINAIIETSAKGWAEHFDPNSLIK